jgi:hypothetical protein
MANVLADVEKGIEVGAETLLKFLNIGTKAATSAGPSVIAGLGVLAGAVDKALTDVAEGAASPATLVLALPSDIADLKAVWPAVTAFLKTLGITV